MKKVLIVMPLVVLLFSGCLKRSTTPPGPEPAASGQPTETATNSAQVSSQNLLELTKSNQDLSTTVKLIEQAGLSQTLQNAGPFTVFVPTDAAFEDLDEAELVELTKTENKSLLIRRLVYHVVPGTYTTADFTDGMKLKTIQGQNVTLTQVRDGWRLTDSAGVTADIEDPAVKASNGTLFIIDSVLSPR